MAQPVFSFANLIKKTGTLAKSSRSKRIDPLTLAKSKVLAALKVQKGYVALVVDNKPLPKNDAQREANTWFSKQLDGWWTSVRYGQQSIPIGEKGECDMLIGELADVAKFYDAVAEAVSKGELDAQIGKLQTTRSEKLKGKKSGTKAGQAQSQNAA